MVAAVNANIPTEMAMKLLQEWNARGYALDAVIYRKYAGSPYVDPHDDEPVAFKDLPNRFPSVLSRDFRKEQGRYEDYDNLVAMYVLTNLARYSVRVNRDSRLVEIDRRKDPMAYAQATALAARSAKADSENFRRRLPFRPRGTAIEDDPECPAHRCADAIPGHRAQCTNVAPDAPAPVRCATSSRRPPESPCP